MKANRGQLERALKTPSPETRFFLLYGPDESGSHALVRTLAAAMGAEAERIDLSGAELRADPARLADEAASISLFGGARYVVVEPAGDEALPAVEALVQASVAGNPVLLVAGALKPTSKLLKLALGEASALAFASYVPEGKDAERVVVEAARIHGLVIRSDVARRIADGCGGNRALIDQELGKYALFLDAAADAPKPLDHEVVDALGAAAEEGDLSRLCDSVANGEAAVLESELLRLKAEGLDGIVLVRAMLRRMHVIARLRAEVDAGNSVSAVMASSGKSVFWMEKDAVALQVQRWRSDLVAKSVGRLMDAERQVKAAGALGPAAVDEELFAICRQAARLR